MRKNASSDDPVRATISDPLSGTLCHELRKTSVAVLAAMSSEFAQWNLKPSEANLLMFVGANPACTQSDIARAHRSNATNLVPLIAGLERNGLLKRVPGGQRKIAISTTAKGQAVLDDVEAGYARLEQMLGADLSRAQGELVVQMLQSICAAACHYLPSKNTGHSRAPVLSGRSR